MSDRSSRNDEVSLARLVPMMANERSASTWRLLALIEIGNFTVLRRNLGRSGADSIVALVAARTSGVADAAAQRVVGRTLIELEMIGDSLPSLDARLAKIEAAFADPVDFDGQLRDIQLVIAAAATTANAAVEGVRLVEAAEGALAVARETGRRILHDIGTTLPGADAVSLRDELVDAIAHEQVFLQYQPKLHVRRQQVASAEALVRWNHPVRGLIYPGDFIPFAEKSGLIGPLTLWTLRRVIADQGVLRSDGRDLTIFVNISGQLLSDAAFVAEACELISANAGRIGIEITETSMIGDPQIAIAHLKILASYGVPIAIDDYGAGLSSLAYLKQLPATELKIDKMFVMELTSSHRDPLIVRSTIDLAHAMEMEVTAEGVETPAALALLTVMGCDLVQGYLLSRPLSLDPLREYLARDTTLPVAPAAYSFGRSRLRKTG